MAAQSGAPAEWTVRARLRFSLLMEVCGWEAVELSPAAAGGPGPLLMCCGFLGCSSLTVSTRLWQLEPKEGRATRLPPCCFLFLGLSALPGRP